MYYCYCYKFNLYFTRCLAQNMNTEDIISEIVSDISSTTNDISLLSVIKKHTSNCGADNFFFGTTLFQNLRSSPDLCVLTDYPDEWQQRYHDKNYFDKDITVIHCRQKSTPIIWPTKNKTISNTNKKIFSESAEFGINSGVSLPFHANNEEHGALATSTPLSYLKSRLTSSKNLFSLQVLGSTLFDYHRSKIKKNNFIKLTEREKECLKWVAAGKTSWEISKIIGVSERTVTFHIQNSSTKMNTQSRTNAAVIAILNNQIKL